MNFEVTKVARRLLRAGVALLVLFLAVPAASADGSTRFFRLEIEFVGELSGPRLENTVTDPTGHGLRSLLLNTRWTASSLRAFPVTLRRGKLQFATTIRGAVEQRRFDFLAGEGDCPSGYELLRLDDGSSTIGSYLKGAYREIITTDCPPVSNVIRHEEACVDGMVLQPAEWVPCYLSGLSDPLFGFLPKRARTLEERLVVTRSSLAHSFVVTRHIKDSIKVPGILTRDFTYVMHFNRCPKGGFSGRHC